MFCLFLLSTIDYLKLQNNFQMIIIYDPEKYVRKQCIHETTPFYPDTHFDLAFNPTIERFNLK